MPSEDMQGHDPQTWAPRVVVVGGGVAGYAAARRINATFPRARVQLFDRNRWHHYSSCGMTFAVEGMYPLEDVVLHTPEQYDSMGIDVHEGVKISGLDLDERTVATEEGDEVPFDILVMASGRQPFIPPVEGADLPGVMTLSNYGDAERVIEAAGDARHAVVVGGGAIGLETAVALRAREAEVTVVEMLPHLLPQMLDEEPAGMVRDHLEERGLRVLTGVPVGRFTAGHDGMVASVEVLGEELKADVVVVAAGVRPEASLAKEAGLDVGGTGGFATDEHLRVLRGGEPVEGCYALGDCAELRHAVTGRKTLSPLASTALYGARSIARHLLDPTHHHRPVVAPAVVVIGDLHVGSVGLTTHAAGVAGLEPWGITGRDVDRSRYFPDARDIMLRLVADQEGRIVGAQAVGSRDVKERMNLMAVVISEGIPAERLVDIERAYSPPVQLLQDPLLPLLEELIDASRALRKQDR
jgi:NADH oxidase (H2O2-forming)